MGFVNVRKFTPFVRNVAVTLGLAPKLPFVSVMKLVMLMVPAAIVNGNWNAGVCAKEVVFVAGPPPPPAAGLIETAQLDQLAAAPVVVHELVTLLAPGMRLTAPRLTVPFWLGKLQY